MKTMASELAPYPCTRTTRCAPGVPKFKDYNPSLLFYSKSVVRLMIVKPYIVVFSLPILREQELLFYKPLFRRILLRISQAKSSQKILREVVKLSIFVFKQSSRYFCQLHCIIFPCSCETFSTRLTKLSLCSSRDLSLNILGVLKFFN